MVVDGNPRWGPDQRGRALQECVSKGTFGERVVAKARRIEVITPESVLTFQKPIQRRLFRSPIPEIRCMVPNTGQGSALLDTYPRFRESIRHDRQHLYVTTDETKGSIIAIVTQTNKLPVGMRIEGLEGVLVREFIDLININLKRTGNPPDPDATIGSIIDAMFAKLPIPEGTEDAKREEEQARRKRIKESFPQTTLWGVGSQERASTDFNINFV